jgi:hypothetical protein
MSEFGGNNTVLRSSGIGFAPPCFPSFAHHRFKEELGMLIDLSPGESVRFGNNVTLTFLGFGASGIQFALEGADHVADRYGGTGHAPFRHESPSAMEEYIPPWLN